MDKVIAVWLTLCSVGFGATVEELLSKSVAPQFPSGSRIVVERARLTRPLSRLVEVSQILPEPGLGLVSFQARTKSGEATSGTAFIRVFAKVAVAKGSVGHKDLFTMKNVAFEERELTSQALRGYFLDLESLSDKRAKGYLRSGQMIGLQNTESPLAVESGESVEIISGRNGLSISAKVRSIDSGRVGDIIRVENQISKRMLRAKIIAPHTAEVSG